MLERVTDDTGVVIYVSPLLRRIGVPHGFSTRIGGVSSPPFDTMNLGNPNGCDIQDDWENVRENYRRLKQAAGCNGRALRRAHQVHGAEVIPADSSHPPPSDPKADALVTQDPRCIVSVRVADCVPVLLSDDEGRTVAAVHAGWRGVVAGVVPVAVEAVRRKHANGIVAAIGPCIGIDAFEVGSDVLEEFRRILGGQAPVRSGVSGKGHIDLREAVRLQLLRAGIPAERIDSTDRCSCRDSEAFFSHRRDRGVTGRMAAIISPRG